MKSIRVKKFLILTIFLIINTQLIKSFMKKTKAKRESENSENLFSSGNNSTISLGNGFIVSAKENSNSNSTLDSEEKETGGVKNNWNDGYAFPNFQIKMPGEQSFTDYGKINVFPKAMETAMKNPKTVNPLVVPNENYIGFNFELQNADKVNVVKKLNLVKYLGGEKFMIPWRFFVGKLIYTNPWGMNNKYITGTFLDDKGDKYEFKFVLPWKLVGWYISNKQSKYLCEICEKMSERQTEIINTLKAEINSIFAIVEANHSTQQTIPNLEKLIKENVQKISNSEINLKEIQAKINSIEKVLSPLRVDKMDLINENNDITLAIEILSKKIEDIKKQDPNMQQNAIKAMKEARQNLNYEFDLLRKIAPDRYIEIDKAREDAIFLNGKSMQNELRKVGPLSLENK